MASDESDEIKKSVGSLIPGIKADDFIPRSFQPEWYAHHKGLLALNEGERYSGPCDEEAVADFLFTGTDITSRKFKEVSPKPVSRLAHEMVKEVNLIRVKPGLIKKVSAKVCTQIHSPLEGVSLQEVSRFVIESGTEITHRKPKPYGSRGTLERRKRIGNAIIEETPEQGGCRELEQEHGHHFVPGDLFSLTGDFPEVTSEESTMYRYPGLEIISINALWMYRVDSPSMDEWQTFKHRRRLDGCIEYEDEGVLIRNRWLPPQT
jgi:hypothetical protein